MGVNLNACCTTVNQMADQSCMNTNGIDIEGNRIQSHRVNQSQHSSNKQNITPEKVNNQQDSNLFNQNVKPKNSFEPIKPFDWSFI